MKAIVNKPDPAANFEFPLIMERKSNKDVVLLFRSKDEAIILSGSSRRSGDYLVGSEVDISLFTPFQGSITLSND